MSKIHQQLFLIIAGKKFAVTAFHCKNDAISTNYHCDVCFTSADSLCFSLGEPVYLLIKDKRYLHGIIISGLDYGKKCNLYFYKIIFYSMLEKLNQLNNKNYVHQKIHHLIEILLQKNNINQYTLQLTKPNTALTYLAQYQQSDLFVFENLLKHCHYFYLWEQQEKHATLKILDDKKNISSLFNGRLLSYKPFNTGTDDEDIVFNKMYTQSAADKEVYFFESNCCDLSPGQILHLSAQENRIYNKSFRIINIEHRGEQISDAINKKQRSLLYRNKLTCIVFSKDFLKPSKKYKTTKTLTAQTTKQNNQVLDEQGHYYLTLNYDPKTITPAFKRTQDFNGNQIAGMHFPLKENTQVLTGFINDDINTPVILGQIPTDKQPSPVTDKNPYQYVVRTAQQSQLILDDKEKNIVLENKNNAILFHQQGIKLNSHQGDLYVTNAKHYTLNTGAHYSIKSKMNYQQTCHRASLLMTKQNGISLQAAENLEITSKQVTHLQSNKIKIQAKNTVEFLATNQSLNIKNSLEILALELLTHLAHQTKLQASKQFTINKNFSLQPNCLKINSQTLEIRAEEIQVYQNSEINS